MHHKFLDQYSDKNSFLHRRDPRFKIFVFVLFMLLVLSMPAGPLCLAARGLLAAVYFALSGLPLSAILARLLKILPFILLAAWSMFSASGKPSLDLLLPVVVKASLAVAAMFILISTTSFSRLLKGLEWFRCPSVIIRMLSFLYRYTYLLLDEFMKMRQAQSARTVVRIRSIAVQLKVFSSMLGHLFVRSYEKGEMVYQAMCSRGYNGSIPSVKILHADFLDYAFLGVSMMCFAAIEVLCHTL